MNCKSVMLKENYFQPIALMLESFAYFHVVQGFIDVDLICLHLYTVFINGCLHVCAMVDVHIKWLTVSFVVLQHNVMIQRRRDGIKPDMPTAAEREEIITALGGKPY